MKVLKNSVFLSRRYESPLKETLGLDQTPSSCQNSHWAQECPQPGISSSCILAVGVPHWKSGCPTMMVAPVDSGQWSRDLPQLAPSQSFLT